MCELSKNNQQELYTFVLMLDTNELWIGDLLKIIKSGKEGAFEGIYKDGRVRVRVGDKMLLVRKGNLEKIDEKLLEKKRFEVNIDDQGQKVSYKDFEKSIDLHIEKLNKNLTNALPERIVDYQVKAFEKYLNDAIRRRVSVITVIHGKGTGTLKSSIHSLVSSSEEVTHFHLVNNDGATEVYFKRN